MPDTACKILCLFVHIQLYSHVNKVSQFGCSTCLIPKLPLAGFDTRPILWEHPVLIWIILHLRCFGYDVTQTLREHIFFPKTTKKNVNGVITSCVNMRIISLVTIDVYMQLRWIFKHGKISWFSIHFFCIVIKYNGTHILLLSVLSAQLSEVTKRIKISIMLQLP